MTMTMTMMINNMPGLVDHPKRVQVALEALVHKANHGENPSTIEFDQLRQLKHATAL